MKITILFCIVITLLGCSEERTQKADPDTIRIVCNKVLAVDTINEPTLYFILEFKISGTSEVSLNNNYMFSDQFSDGGLFIEDSILYPGKVHVGSVLRSNNFVVKPNKILKLLFVFNNQVGDSISKAMFSLACRDYQKRFGKEWVSHFIEHINLSYKYSDNQKNENEQSKSNHSEVINRETKVQIFQPKIFYFQRLTVEEEFSFMKD